MKILVAEKDASLRELIMTRLSARHYEVCETDSSEEVMRVLERQTIDLILLSTEMERIGGILLIEKIRQKPQYLSIPIILITEEDQIADLVMSRERGFDDFLSKPFNPLVLQLRVAINISRARQRVEANALTHLPGNTSIERVICGKIASGEKFSVLYLDVNNFKSFNDRYGFEKGDDVLRQTAQLLLQTSEALAENADIFVGHIGGDDFIVVLHPDKEEAFARRFLAEFDRIMPTYYNEKDQKEGSVRVKNRQGKLSTFPLMSCSIAACNNLNRQYKNMGEIAQDAAEVKSFLKTQTGSHYLRDRRFSPIRKAEEAMAFLAPEIPVPNAVPEADPLGQVLVNAGLITHEQLTQALKKHLETGQRLGQVLIQMNAVRSSDVGRMLQKKLNVPYICLKEHRPTREMMRLFTMEFIRAHRVLPLEMTESGLKLGMCDPFDIRVLDSIERITGLKPVPCLTLEDEFEEFLERTTAAK
jgi:diguanylate cyclase (GGDEF)-like protein